MKLRKGLEPCPACGAIIRPAARTVPHPETDVCKAAQVQRAYRDRGWTQAHGATVVTLEAAGVAVEWAPGRTDTEGKAVRTSFAPRDAVRALRLLQNIVLKAPVRVAVLRRMLADPVLVDAVRALRRLSRCPDHDVGEWARELVRT